MDACKLFAVVVVAASLSTADAECTGMMADLGDLTRHHYRRLVLTYPPPTCTVQP